MKKQALLLGTAGALALGAGAVARTIPVIALEESGSVAIEVTVLANAPTIVIEGIEQDAEYTTPNFDLKIPFTDAETIDYVLVYTNPYTGEETTYTIDSKVFAAPGNSESGVDSLPLNLDDFGGEYGYYRIHAINQGNGVAEDSVAFIYTAIAHPKSIDEDEGGNPIVKADISEGTEKVLVQIKNESGKVVGEVPTDVNKNDNTVTVNMIHVAAKLPNGLPDGKYVVTLISIDAENNRLWRNASYEINYMGLVEVPDTGGSSFEAFGLSNSDFTAVLMVLFVFAVLGGMLILKKTSSKKTAKATRRNGRR